MDDLRLHSATGPRLGHPRQRPFRTEAELRRFVVQHAVRLIDVRVLAAEYPIDRNGGGRIDALGIDANDAPVVVEFKRNAAGLTICQGLYYLDWLEQHREVFAEVVLRRIGERVAAKISWNSARLLCIAEEISPREEAVARQIGREVELLQLRRYSRGLVTIQSVQTTKG